MVALRVIQLADAERLARAAAGLASGVYTITLAAQDAQEIRGFVANGDNREYGVVLREGEAFCSCRDAMYRRRLCKHAVLLSLYAIRHPDVRPVRTACPQGGTPQETSKPDLKLARTKSDFCG